MSGQQDAASEKPSARFADVETSGTRRQFRRLRNYLNEPGQLVFVAVATVVVVALTVLAVAFDWWLVNPWLQGLAVTYALRLGLRPTGLFTRFTRARDVRSDTVALFAWLVGSAISMTLTYYLR